MHHLALSLPVPGRTVFDFMENRGGGRERKWGSHQRKETASKSQTGMDVEPVFPAGGVHRQ